MLDRWANASSFAARMARGPIPALFRAPSDSWTANAADAAFLAVAGDAVVSCGASFLRMKAALSWLVAKEKTMRVLSQYELCLLNPSFRFCCTRSGANRLALRNAHLNLFNIRQALARPEFRPR
jgi:hypothetical protein